MKSVTIMAIGLMLGTMTAQAQEAVEIQSFEQSGQMRFTKISTAMHYRVEWSSSGTSWTTFAEAAVSLDQIVSPGSGIYTASVPTMYRVVASYVPANMVLIPAGDFMMGPTTNVGHEYNYEELPQHTVYVSEFYMDQYPVTKGLWDQVKAYNGGNGYSYSNNGLGKAVNHPVHSVNWYDCVKWCNARSERDGLTPVYYNDESFTTVYRTGAIEPYPDWLADGYRLPTEAEREKAARGGVADTRFPWTDYTNKISWAKANYYGMSNIFSYDLNGGNGAYNPNFSLGGAPYTSPVGYFSTNGYGLFDMSGNVWEWCWDWFETQYYTSSSVDPIGPSSGSSRVARGGAWDESANHVRVAYRGRLPPGYTYSNTGFRCVRRR